MRRLESFWHKLRSRTFVADTLFALLFFAIFGLATTMTLGHPEALFFSTSERVNQVWAFLLCIPVAFRRIYPHTAPLVFLGIVTAQVIFGPILIQLDVVSMILLYSALVYDQPKYTRRWILTAFIAELIYIPLCMWASLIGPYQLDTTLSTQDIQLLYPCRTILNGDTLSPNCLGNIPNYGITFGALIIALTILTIVLAFWHRARQQTVTLLQERNRAIAASTERESRIAALAERARIARDMHDVVAHTLSIIIIQSDGGRYAGTHDVPIARQTMETIQHESERALHDMQQLLSVFSTDTRGTYQDIDPLIDQSRQVCTTMTFTRTVHGLTQPTRLNAAAQDALFHVVQESLTNIRKYAGTHVHVDIAETWDNHGVTITITDNGQGNQAALDGHIPGMGLLGMRERIDAVHGTLISGALPSGGWQVQATIPYPNAIPHADSTPARGARATLIQERLDSPTVSTPAHDTRQSSATLQHSTPVSELSDNNTPGINTTAPVAANPWWQAWRARIPVRAISQTHRTSINMIERLARWTERHYVIMDTLVTLIIMGMLLMPWFQEMFDPNSWDFSFPPHLITAFALLETAPLAIRRRFPRTSALLMASLYAIQLLFLPGITTADILALFSVYSLTLYGRSRARFLAFPLATVMSCLFAFHQYAEYSGYPSIVSYLLRLQYLASGSGARSTAITQGMLVWVLCMIALGLARWMRSTGTNAQVLRMRQDALTQEADKRRILAANEERDRISAALQEEITTTLTRVIDETRDNLAMLDRLQREHRDDPQAISTAFQAIGAQGRQALAHVRELLAILRATGFSDEHSDTANQALNLAPARSLEEQLQGVSSQS